MKSIKELLIALYTVDNDIDDKYGLAINDAPKSIQNIRGVVLDAIHELNNNGVTL